MVIAVEALWSNFQEVLSEFGDRVAATDRTLTHDLGKTKNSSFDLRAYSAFRKHGDGAEVAVTVDVQTSDEQVTITSDAGYDDGRIIARGPSTVISASEESSNVEVAMNNWLSEFKIWLRKSEASVAVAASRL